MTERKEVMKKDSPSIWSLWDPFEEMRDFRHGLSHLFKELVNGGHRGDWALDIDGGRASWFPAVNVEESEKEYVFTADVPGLQREDFNVEVDKGLLKIRGERKKSTEEKGKGYIRKEQFYGTFNRVFALPTDAKMEGIKADYKNGVLTIRVARSETLRPKSVKIDVQ